jgi:hypothetical protein
MSQPSPLKRNLILRFTKGEGSTRNDERCIDRRERRYEDCWKGKTYRSLRQLFYLYAGDRAPWSDHVALIVNPLCLIVSSDALEGEGLYQDPCWCWQLPFVWGFKIKMIFGMSGDDIFLDRSNMMDTRSHVWDHGDMNQKWTTQS